MPWIYGVLEGKGKTRICGFIAFFFRLVCLAEFERVLVFAMAEIP